MKKKDVISRLKELGMLDEEIKEMDYNEMRAKLKALEEELANAEANGDSIEEEAELGGGSDEQEATQEERGQDEDDTVTENDNGEELVLEYELQLRVHERRIVRLHPDATRIVIDNPIGGDLFFNEKEPKFNSNRVIVPGDSKEFTEDVFITSASRPILLITQYK